MLDVRDRPAYARVADEAESRLGPVSILCNNAGVGGGTHVTRLTYEYWDWVMGINLNGVINGIQTFLPRMLERGGGAHIVNTASGAGLAATTSGLLYTTSKFAVVGLSEALRRESVQDWRERFVPRSGQYQNTLEQPRHAARRVADCRGRQGSGNDHRSGQCLSGARRRSQRRWRDGPRGGKGRSALYSYRSGHGGIDRGPGQGAARRDAAGEIATTRRSRSAGER